MQEDTNIIMSMAIPNIEFQKKYNLTIEEACAYFGIGKNTLRRIVQDNPDADYLLHIGTKTLIKKSRFEEFINGLNVL